MINKGLGFKNVYLIPNKSIAESRDFCDPSVAFGGTTYLLGVVPSNMKSVVSVRTCHFLHKKGIFYIMHRFGESAHFLNDYFHDNGMYSSISLGIDEHSITQLDLLQNCLQPPEYITIDVANAYSTKALEMIKRVRQTFPYTFLIAGTVATPEAVIALEESGVDATRVGISTGFACSTYLKTGFGVPQFTAVQECAKVARKPIISDGGIRNVGDIAKAYVAGATMVMAGQLFAGYEESAGEVIEIDGKKYKLYYGSASFQNRRSPEYIEGESMLVPYKVTMHSLIDEINDGVRSAISYAGGLDMKAFSMVEYGVTESF